MDGRDYFDARHQGGRAVEHVRAGLGPALVHATVTRPYSHSMADAQSRYRLPEELAAEIEHDPILMLQKDLVRGNVLTMDEVARIRDEVRQVVAEAAKEALGARRPDPAAITDHVYALPRIPDPLEPTEDVSAHVVTMGEAVRRLLHEVMEGDERVRVFGEDVADAPEQILDRVEGKGGVLGTTQGSSAHSVRLVATTRRWPRPTSSDGPWARRSEA